MNLHKLEHICQLLKPYENPNDKWTIDADHDVVYLGVANSEKMKELKENGLLEKLEALGVSFDDGLQSFYFFT